METLNALWSAFWPLILLVVMITLWQLRARHAWQKIGVGRAQPTAAERAQDARIEAALNVAVAELVAAGFHHVNVSACCDGRTVTLHCCTSTPRRAPA